MHPRPITDPPYRLRHRAKGPLLDPVAKRSVAAAFESVPALSHSVRAEPTRYRLGRDPAVRGGRRWLRL